MRVLKRHEDSGRGVAAPLVWILLLLAGYWLIIDWQDVPQIIASAIARLS